MIRSSLFTPRGKKGGSGEREREGRVVVSRARREIIYPTKVAALRGRSKDRPWLHYVVVAARASIRAYIYEEERALDAEARGRTPFRVCAFLARVSFLSLSVSHLYISFSRFFSSADFFRAVSLTLTPPQRVLAAPFFLVRQFSSLVLLFLPPRALQPSFSFIRTGRVKLRDLRITSIASFLYVKEIARKLASVSLNRRWEELLK